MKYINVETIEGIKKEIVYNVKDFPYEHLKFCNGKCKKRNKEYLNIVATFDIEATTIKPKNECERPYGFMYQWQFCINGEVIFGRYWTEFLELLYKLHKTLRLTYKKNLVIYVHNLSYEFQFIKDFLRIESVFAREKHKVMKFNCNEGFEFRCSYLLSNMSLSKFCENTEGCIHYKLTDQYDYKKLRTPKTKLTEIEEGYCFNDVMGLYECIMARLKEDNLATIPLTNTGYVRREYRNAMKTKENRKLFEKIALDEHLYKMCVKAFRGGNTHANRFLANQILEDVYSYDITSSYPTSINCDLFPMGKFSKVTIDNQEKLDRYLNEKCCLIDICFYNIELNINEVIPYIDIAHCQEKKNIVNDNGRVLKADYIRMTLTDIDLQIIRDTYHYECFTINEFWAARRGKLPKELRLKMMEYYDAKTMLKDVEGKEYEYAKSKNSVNSTFGMMVTAIDHDEIIYNSDTMLWDRDKPNIEESLLDFYKSRNSFLAYQWGVWVTANARKRLQDMLKVVGMDVVYIDTDSIKFQNKEHIKEFEEKNKEVLEMVYNNDIRAYSVNKDGKEFPLGVWDNDGNYLKFKTLGAKKYCYNKIKKGNEVFEITVSGMAKKKGARAVGSIENFNIGKTFEDVGRTVSWYNDAKPHTIKVNGEEFLTASNIGVLETTYTLGVTNEYWELIYQNNNEIYSYNF